MAEQLSPFKIKRGRRVFDSYSAINSFSFALVTGNTVTLYALALGASSTVVGLLSAFMFLSFYAIPLGKLGLRRWSLVRTFANNWMVRNWSLVPLLAIPYLYSIGHAGAAVSVLVACVFLFNFFRGMGLIANNPVIGALAPGKDRGEYIVRLSLINNGTALAATCFLAFLLWRDAGIETYNLAVLIGIVSGIAASSLLYRLPDPGSPAAGDRAAAPEPGAGFFPRLREAAKDANFRRFVASYLVIGLGIGMARPFIVVYCKEVYGQADAVVTVFTICASLGALATGSVMRLVIDRLGAKPLFIIFAWVSLVSLVPALVAPGIGFAGFALAFLCLLSAATNMGFVGQENAAQTYFFAMVPKDALMDLSMLYYFILGGTGAIGSVLGGGILDLLSGAGLSPLASFRLFFVAVVAVIALGIRIQRGLQNFGSYPVRETLAILLSPRDMRALTLLKRLDSSDDPDEETGIIAELGEVASTVSADNLLDHLSSPRYAVRSEALRSIAALESLPARVRDALLAELETGSFVTAATAARLLGQFRVAQAVPALRAALASEDYLLAGEAMLALASLADARGQAMIGDLLAGAKNPHFVFRGIQAMEAYGNPASVPILLSLLRRNDLPPRAEEEALLALAYVLGFQKRFYYALEAYAQDPRRAETLVLDAFEELAARRKVSSPDALRDAVISYLRDPALYEPFTRAVLGLGKGRTGVCSALLVAVALDADLNASALFRFFLAFWAASLYGNPRLIEK